jgi:hypothetical protein
MRNKRRPSPGPPPDAADAVLAIMSADDLREIVRDALGSS